MSKFKRSLDSIQLPEDAKASVRARIEAAAEEKPKARRISFKRLIPAAVAAALIVALTLALLPMFRTGANIDEENNVRPGSNWVANAFPIEEGKNSGGVIKNEGTGSSGWGGIGWGEAVKDHGFAGAPDAIDGDYTIEVIPGEVIPGDPMPGVPADPAGWDDYEEPADGDYEEPTDFPVHNVDATAGTLTAGYTDDNRDFGNFKNALSKLPTAARGFKSYECLKVTVPGVSNALVALADAQGQVIGTARTDINGVAYVYYNLFGGKYIPAKVGASKGEAFAELELPVECDVVLPLECEKESVKLDMMIMLDTTGSMGDELEYIKAELSDMISRISREGQTVDIRISVNFYRDHSDEYTVKYYEFTESVEKCLTYLSQQHANGGGDYPEAVDEALVNGICDHAWRDDAVKVMFMILDAPAHSENERQGVNANLAKAISKAAESGIRIVPIVGSGADDDLECTMRTAAAVSGGRYIFLTDHSGIGGGHKDPEDVQSGTYFLNDLMVETVLRYIKPENE